MYCKKKKSIWINIFVYMFSIIFLLSFLSLTNFNFSYAEENYTNVLEDLQKDETFSIEDYPLVENDYGLQLITIAESEDNELFLYVYQPSADLYNIKATSINMSIEENLMYDLTLINYEGVFYKYKVNDYFVEIKETRIYEIVSIFRPFDERFDEPVEGNIVNEVSYGIGKKYIISTIDNGNIFLSYDIETIKIEQKYIGFVRYETGANFWGTSDSIDSHFIAFSTDREIEKLLEVNVYYEFQSVHYQENGNEYQFGEIEKNYSKVKDKQSVTYKSDKGFWYNYTYEKKRIQTVQDFIDNEDFTLIYKGALFDVKASYNMDEEALNYIKTKDWVVRFADTNYTFTPGWYGGTHDYTNVSNVSIMNLIFETDGKIYNLGVIDNKQTGSGLPDNNVDYELSLSDIFKLIFTILMVIVLLILFIVFWPFLSPILLFIVKFLFKCFKYLFKGLYWLFIKAPLSLFIKKE